jgi:hypothetical protein
MTTPTVPRKWHNSEDHLSRVADTVNLILKGKINNTGTVTLTANQATTTLTDIRIGIDSHLSFMPTTANASAEIGAGTLYVSARGNQTATITHANNAQTDRTFIYTVTG